MQADGRIGRLVGFTAFGAATAWNAGNIGPAAGAIGSDLGVSLAAVGVLGGTVFFAGLVLAKLGAARLTSRVGSKGGIRVACLAAVAGNAVIAISPVFAGSPPADIRPGGHWASPPASSRAAIP